MMTLKEVAENMRLFAESGSNPLPETIDKWLDSIDIHLLSQPQPVAQGDAVDETMEYRLRAMALNYSDRHSWDHLDTEVCAKASDEIKALRSALSHSMPPVERKLCPGCNGENGSLGPNMGYVSCRDCDGEGFIEFDGDDATPTIPTGHRVETVADVTLREAAEEALDLLEHVDPQHGITTQLRNALAASPSALGV